MHNMIYDLVSMYNDIEYTVIGYSDAWYNGYYGYDGPDESFYDQAKGCVLRGVRRFIDDPIWYEVREELSNE